MTCSYPSDIRRPRDSRGDRESLRYQSEWKEEEVVRTGDGRTLEGWWSSSKERWVEEKRKRSSSREDFLSSTSRYGPMEGNRVYISWDRFVPKSFLYAHFSSFGEVEFIWMADRAFFGFVNFVSGEVGRALVGACHDVGGVRIEIREAKPDWRIQDRERRRVETCAFFKEGRCLRQGHCKFLHPVESRNSRRRSRSRSRERARRKEMSGVDRGAEEVEARRDRDGRSKMKEQEKGSRKSPDLKAAHLKAGSSERNRRLRPLLSVSDEARKGEQISMDDEARKREQISMEEKLEAGPRTEIRGNEPKGKSCGENMDPVAMMERIKQLEEALKEKEEAEDRKRRFLMAGKPDKNWRVKDEDARLPGQSSRGSRKNCHLVKSLAKRYKGVENKSTSSSSEDADGYDSTSDSHTQSPSPPARKLQVGSESLGDHSPTDSKVQTPESMKLKDQLVEVSGQETKVEEAVGRKIMGHKTSFATEVSTGGKEGVVEVSGCDEKKVDEEGGEEREVSGQPTNVEGVEAKDNQAKETMSKEAVERYVPATTSGQDSYCDEENIEIANEEQDATNEEEEQEWFQDEWFKDEKNERGEDIVVDVNENKLGSEKDADCGKDLASVDLCEVPTTYIYSFFAYFLKRACFLRKVQPHQ